MVLQKRWQTGEQNMNAIVVSVAFDDDVAQYYRWFLFWERWHNLGNMLKNLIGT